MVLNQNDILFTATGQDQSCVRLYIRSCKHKICSAQVFRPQRNKYFKFITFPQKLEFKRKKVTVNWIKKMSALECMLALPWEWDSKGFANLNEVGKGYSVFQEKNDLLPI